MDKDAAAVQRWIQLPDKTKRFFEQLEEKNIDTLEVVAEAPAEDVTEIFVMVRNAKVIGKFFKWLIVGVLGIFLGTIMFWEGMLKVFAWFKI
ncbi:hypothetical protein [Phyllobacterium sp. YR531]|uniref:hypothetical protein n=1 Tax=Phyllobacterium sp. YR531 TaxID=1144343 RepID=UPI0002E291BE|nr:hypothetical protein [Phyllobacterium sp. YR531]